MIKNSTTKQPIQLLTNSQRCTKQKYDLSRLRDTAVISHENSGVRKQSQEREVVRNSAHRRRHKSFEEDRAGTEESPTRQQNARDHQ